MSKCISTSSLEFKSLTEMSGISSIELAAKMNLWMEENNTDVWPTLEQLGIEYEKPEDLESKEISETETVEDSYMANFDPDGEFNFAEYDDILRQIDGNESEFDLNEDILSVDEKKEGLNLSFANLTSTLIYQHNDIKKEIQNLYGQLKDAKTKDRPAIKSKIAKTNQKRQELVDKIKESKKLSNLEQLLQFGNDAINEVSQILSEGGLTDKQLNYLKRITDFWMRAGDFKSSQFDHILFGKDYETKIDESIEDGLVAIAERMKKLDREVNSIGRDFIVRMVKKQLGNTYTEDNIYKAIKDINWGEANAFGISDYSSPLLSAVYAVMHDADKKAAWEFEELIKQLDDKFKAAERHLSGKSNNKYYLFYQSHNGQLTGDLVGVYSKAYLDKKAELISAAQKASPSDKAAKWKEFKDWSKENETYIDIRLLFPEKELNAEQTEVAKVHIKSIIDKIGQRQFDRIYNQLENAIEDYNYALVQELTRIDSTPDLTEEARWQYKAAWEHKMSPYIELDRRLGVLNADGTYGSTDVRFNNQVSYADKGIRGLRSIPKAEINGKSSDWYDSKYEQISKNKELLDLYEYIQDTMDYMRSILPEHLRNHVGSNTMPMIMKSITELYKQNSAIGMANLWNSAQKSFVVNESSETEFDEIDVNTGIKVGGLKPRTFMHSERIISERLKIKQAEFLAKNGVESTKEDDINLRKEVIDQLNLERSFDLPKVMKIYIHSLISHKHKSNVDDLIKIARRELDAISEISVSEAGVDQYTPEGKLRTQVGLKRMKESLDYAIKAFQGGQLHTPEGRSSKKRLSYLEKKELSELLATKDKLQIQFDNGKIDEAQLAKSNKIIDDKIAKLGGYVALSKIGDNLLKYTQLKGMGFNVIAGGVNLLTGWMENSIRAADGRWFNETQLNQSLRDAYTTIFDPARKSKNTKKLINIEKRFHLVEDASQELYKEENKFGEVVYVIVKKTEFLNVMSMAGAFMRNIPVTNDKGEKSNLYEAFDENGNIKAGWKLSDTKSNEDFLLDVDLRMLKLKHKIHGNYGDRLKGKENILGRMAFQFRTWMPEMYNARFGKQGFDDILQKEVRGRWLSIGKVVKGSEFEGNQFTAADNILYTLGQLGRKILFMRTSFDGRMSEMDAANMKANLMELHFMLGLMALMLILKAAVPDEEKKKNFSYNFLINMIIRQQNDIMVFANPMTFEQINKNVLPVMSVLTDTDTLIRAVKNEFSDDDRKTGKSLGKLAKMLPPLGQGVRIFQYGEKQIAQQ